MKTCALLLLAAAPLAAEPLALTRWDKFAVDPAVLLDGRATWAWPQIDQNVSVNALGTPTDWTPYRYLRFSIHVAAPTDSILTLVIESQNPETEGPDYYSVTVRTDFSGWKHYSVALGQLGKARQPLGLDRVGKVYWSSNWAHQLDPATVVHLADLRLDAAAEDAISWRRFREGVGDEVKAYGALAAELTAFAQRTGMWDAFGLLTRSLAAAGDLPTALPADLEAAARTRETLGELAYTAPWWRKIFLDDAALFDGLNLDLPGLAQVKAAVAAQDWPAARRELWVYYRQRTKPSYYAKYETPPVRSAAITRDARADELVAHRFTMAPYPTQDLGPDFNWHVKPGGDVEWPTKVHRHFHWSSLAAAYRKTGAEVYAAELVQQLYDWAKDNPLERWNPARSRWSWSTLNTTIRIYSSWIDSWLQIRDAAAWTPDAQFVMLTALREHGRFLMANHASQGNWVVAESQGLVELGVMFPEFREAQAWRDEGYRRLERELAVQVLSDGLHVERTPGYHGMTLGCFMEPIQLGLLNEVAIPAKETFVAKLEQMHEFYLYGSKPNRRMEQIGDSGMMSVDGQLRRGWEMFRRQDMQYVLTEGQEGKPPVHRSYAFDGGGFYVSRSAWNDRQALWSILDWGGFLGHCHLDQGQLSVYAYGTELLIDTGIFAYAFPERANFYNTVGHNTVLVDNTSQKRGDPLTAQWTTTPAFDFFRGTTDKSEPLIHERNVAFVQPGRRPGYWLVVDRLTGEGKHRLDQRWHATERLQAKATGSTVVLTGKPDVEPQPSLVVAGLPQAGLQTAVAPGEVSYSWYKKLPVDVPQFTLDGPVPARFVTVLVPTPPGTPPAEVTVTEVPVTLAGGATAATACRVVIAIGGERFEDLWMLRHDEAGQVTAGGVSTDGRVAMVRAEGNAATWLAAGASFLRRGDADLCRAAAPVEGLALTVGDGPAALVSTAARDLVVACGGPVTLNGEPAQPAGGVLRAATVTPPAVLAPPKDGPPRFEIVPPPPPLEASATAQLLPADAAPPAGSAVLEAEALRAEGGGKAEIDPRRAGASGACLWHWDAAGHWLEWSATVPRAGRYALWLRVCAADVGPLRKVMVNGRVATGGDAVRLPATGGWSREKDDWRWQVVLPAADLPAGESLVRLENVDGQSLNVDRLALVAVP